MTSIIEINFKLNFIYIKFCNWLWNCGHLRVWDRSLPVSLFELVIEFSRVGPARAGTKRVLPRAGVLWGLRNCLGFGRQELSLCPTPGYSHSHFPPRVRGLWDSPELPYPRGSSGTLVDLNDFYCTGWIAELLNYFYLLTTLGNCPWSWDIYCSNSGLTYLRDQALSLWSGSTDSKTLDYQRTNPWGYQIMRTHTKETTGIQDPAIPKHQ